MALSASANAELVYGVTDNQSLVRFDSATPETIIGASFLSGLQQNEQILGIDFRPATGQLYGLGSFNNLYTIDVTNGAASLVGSGFSDALSGSSFGFDFNPTIDRIRVVSEADQNLVLNPNTGGSTAVTDLFYAAGDPNEGADPNIAGSAYTNSVAGATTTQLYGIDTGLDVLVTQANSAGTLETVGSLGVDLNDVLGFDISGASGTAFASVEMIGLSRSTFWTIDLSTGAATMIDEIGGGAVVTSIAVVPAPSAAGLAFVGALVGTGVRRR
ncbi:MAG: DUF4394 domain-containing protein [Planctomycetota bacterium]